MRRPLWDSPVFTQEMRIWRRQMANRRRVVRAILITLVAIVGAGALWEAVASGGRFAPTSLQSAALAANVGLFLICVVGAHLIPISISSVAIADERAHQSLLPIMATQVTPLQFVVGKFLATVVKSIVYMLWLGVLTIASCLLNRSAMAPSDWCWIPIISVMLTATIWSLSAIGMFLSTLSSSPLYARLLAMCIVLPLALAAPIADASLSLTPWITESSADYYAGLRASVLAIAAILAAIAAIVAMCRKKSVISPMLWIASGSGLAFYLAGVLFGVAAVGMSRRLLDSVLSLTTFVGSVFAVIQESNPLWTPDWLYHDALVLLLYVTLCLVLVPIALLLAEWRLRRTDWRMGER